MAGSPTSSCCTPSCSGVSDLLTAGPTPVALVMEILGPCEALPITKVCASQSEDTPAQPLWEGPLRHCIPFFTCALRSLQMPHPFEGDKETGTQRG